MKGTDKGLTITQVCEEWGISRATGYRNWRKWPYYMLGGTPRFKRADMEHYFSPAGRIDAETPQVRGGRVVIQRSHLRSKAS